MASPPSYQRFVGVDIAAATFVAAWDGSDGRSVRPMTFEQTADGFTAFQQRLAVDSIPPHETLLVLEATGSYWTRLAVTLHQAGYVVAVVNPAHVHNYAKSLPRRSKTDARDAQLLAQFGRERRPPPWTPPSAIYHELRQRLLIRDSLVEMRQQARNQRHALQQWPVVVSAALDHLQGLIADFDTRIATLDRELAALLEASEWAESAALLSTIPGIGLQTTAWLLVVTLNFTLCATPEAAAAYVGLVPQVRESGTSVRGRGQLGHVGNARLRTALYVATVVATRFNPTIKTFYERLRSAGKAAKVARCAAARKLLHLAFAVVTKGRPFDATYGQEKPGGTAAAVTGGEAVTE